jgi:hypothetical protein
MRRERRLVERTASIHVREVRKSGMLPGAEAVSIRLGDHPAEGVQLIWRDTPFGGKRAYFRCPHCLKGAEILYAAPYLACKACHNLAYRGENLTPLWRRSEKLRKLQKRAGLDTSRLPCLPAPKPLWMRWHTFLRLRQAIKAADHDFAAAWLRSLSRAGILR